MNIEMIQKQADDMDTFMKGYRTALEWMAGQLKAEEAKKVENANTTQKD